MRLRRIPGFLLHVATLGIALGALALVLRADLGQPTVVEFREAPARATDMQQVAEAGAPPSYARAVAAAAPAVVNIHTEKAVVRQLPPMFEDPALRRFFEDEQRGNPRPQQETSLGSGVIVNHQGYILTNFHVIDGAEDITIALQDGQSFSAAVIGSDPETDLAVLKINGSELPSIILGRSSGIHVGDVVLAIGNPFGVGQTVTSGIVSATGRTRLGLSTFENFIQTDAAINPGNSGGALVNAQGELLGINTAIFSRTGGSQGIGFAIPVDLAKTVLSEILEHGSVTRGWLGIEIQDVTPELAESFGLDEARGIVVAGVLRGGPAERAGLQPGDVIVRIEEQAIRDVAEALEAITAARPGETLQLHGVRAGKPIAFQSTVQRRPQQPG
ncbi:Do family serine endopeptidase [Ectothiorhodospiraceae bacterium 2226]|nr:Do family serine endopeptidase [Ectothiorhodospiraceae bacterium 2226]